MPEATLRTAAPSSRTQIGAAALSVVALAVAVYWPVGDFGFVAYDDLAYVADNEVVRRGLSLGGVAWAFTTFTAANWHPLTWLSLMLDVSLFGVDPGWHHRINLAWHCAGSLLLFVFLLRATGSTWPSWSVAALFAVHPLHVESVAWIAERKDVLSAFFWLLAMLAHQWNANRPSMLRGASVGGAMALGLLAKPMLVTLPFALLLLDIWPLRRIQPGAITPRSLWVLVRQKLPLLALSVLASAITWTAQARSGAVRSMQWLPPSPRVGNAVLSYVIYLEKTVWPLSLAALYPHPGYTESGVPALQVAGAVLTLAVLSGLAIWQWRTRPVLLVGWLWYLGTLIPVIGLVQVGQQGMADRYTYLPSIGLFFAFTWGFAALMDRVRLPLAAQVAAAAAAVLACSVVARHQVGYWRDTEALFSHATEVTRGNWLAWKNLGAEQYRRGKIAAAMQSFEWQTAIAPTDPDGWFNLGMARNAMGRYAEAADAFEQAVRVEPADVESWFDLGIASALARRLDRSKVAVARLRAIDSARADALEALLRGPSGTSTTTPPSP